MIITCNEIILHDGRYNSIMFSYDWSRGDDCMTTMWTVCILRMLLKNRITGTYLYLMTCSEDSYYNGVIMKSALLYISFWCNLFIRVYDCELLGCFEFSNAYCI